MDKSKNFLPSKKFITSVLIILVIIGVFFVIRGIFSLFRKGSGGLSNNSKVEMTVGTIIQKDSNKNGIADWEEYLWGLDPNRNGPENKEFILNKKRTLEQGGVMFTPDDSKSITENEMLSRQFFATIISLQQTGNLNEENLASIAESIGQEVKIIEFENIYTDQMLNIRQDSTDVELSYLESFINLFEKYQEQDIGSELILISQGLVYNDPQALYSAMTVAGLYRSFAKELMSVVVPSSIAMTHLSLVNNYDKIGKSIEELGRGLSDSIVGMKAMLSYKKYTDDLAIDLEKISEILQ